MSYLWICPTVFYILGNIRTDLFFETTQFWSEEDFSQAKPNEI